MARVQQVTFAGGELDPLLHGRVDLAQRQNSVALARNFFAKVYGGLCNRAGTRYVDDLGASGRLIPFRFGGTQTYAMAFTDRAIRWYTDGGRIDHEPTIVSDENADFSDGFTHWSDESTGSASVALGDSFVPIDVSGATLSTTMTNGAAVATAFDGETDVLASGCLRRKNTNVARLDIDWGSGNTETIEGLRLYGSSDYGFRSNEPSITFRLYGSADNFGTLTKLWERVVTDSAGLVVEAFDGITIDTAYRYHRIEFQAANEDRDSYLAEVELFSSASSIGRATLAGASNGVAILRREITSSTPSAAHAIRFQLSGDVGIAGTFRVGNSAGASDIVADRSVGAGWHMITFPVGASGTYFIDFQNASTTPLYVEWTDFPPADTADPVMELPTPYTSDQLRRLSWTQSADVMTFVHPSHPPYELRRYGHRDWSLTKVLFQPEIQSPEGEGLTVNGTSGSTSYSYVVTASADGKESLPSGVATTSSGNATLSSTNSITIAWDAVAGADIYDIYKLRNGLYGYIGSSESTSFTDTGITAEVDDTPPKAKDHFSGTGNWPQAVGYFEQRLGFYATLNKPETGYLSRTADYRNFSVSEPLKDDDAITFTLVGDEISEIRHVVPMKSLLFLTTTSPWSLRRSDTGLTPALEGGISPEDGPPADYVRPLRIGSHALYVQAGGNGVIDLAYDLGADGYQASDALITAGHLLRPRRLVEWSYAPRPWSLIHAVTDDGLLLTMTYQKQHQVVAWTRNDTYQGKFISVCAVNEGDEEGVYFIIRRRINGVVKWFVERQASRRLTSVKDAFFVDCGLTYDTPHAISAISLAEPVVLTVPGHDFLDGDLVDVEGIEGTTELNDRRFRVGVANGDTITLLTEIASDPAADDYIDGTGYTAWIEGGLVRKAVSSVTGLDHLVGETVVVLADGGAEARTTLSSSTYTLGHPASRVHVGLPYDSDITTLPLAGEPELTARHKVIKSVQVWVDSSRNLQVGPSLTRLSSFKPELPSMWDTPQEPTTRMARVPITGSWAVQPSVSIRQPDPLPIEVLGIIPDFDLGG